jgi:hypothetical protein
MTNSARARLFQIYPKTSKTPSLINTLYNDSETIFSDWFSLERFLQGVEPAATHSFSHKHADACFNVEGRASGMHSLGRDCHFNLSFCKRFPLCMQAKVWRYLSTTFGEWATSSLLRAVRRQACTLFSPFTHTKFPLGTGAFAHMICFLAGNGTSNRLEAEGNVQIIWAGKHIGMGQAGMAVRGGGGCGIAWQGLIHVDALIAFVFFHFLS